MSAPDATVPVDPARAAESNLGQILGVTTTFHVLALVFVGLRLYVRMGMVKATGRDDWTMVAAAVSNLWHHLGLVKAISCVWNSCAQWEAGSSS